MKLKFLVLLSCVIIVLTFSVGAKCAVIFVNPAGQGNPEIGKDIRFEVRAENAKGLVGYEFDLAFDNKALKVKKITEGPFLKSDGAFTFFTSPEVDFCNKIGMISNVDGVRLLSSKGVYGEGVMAIVTFEVLSNIEIKLELREVKIQTEDGNIWDGHIPMKIEAGKEITFDASEAGISSGRIVSYEWNFGDGEKAIGGKVKHTYKKAKENGIYEISLKIVMDQKYSTTYIVTGNPPVADSQSLTMNEDGPPIVITLTGSDPDGDVITSRITSQPSNGTLIGTSPNLNYKPNPGYSGIDYFTFVTYDGTIESEPAAITIIVEAVNDQPVIMDIPDQTIDEGGTFTTIKLDDFISDLDNTDAEMKWIFTGNAKLTVSISNDRVVTITVPDPEWNGSESITFTATDPAGLSASDSAKFIVKPVNDPPVVTDIPDQTINEGGIFTNIKLDDFVSDPDNTDAEMKWAFSGNTKLAVYISNDRIATITLLDPIWSGSEIITLTAKDPGGLSASGSAKFTVNPVNKSPIVSKIPDQTVEEGKLFASIKLDDYVTDIDNKDSEIKWTVTGNVNIMVTIGTDRIAIIGVKELKWNGSETITFTAKDPSGLSSSVSAKYTVTPVNDPPVVSDILDQSIIAGQDFASIKLDNYITDPDNADSEITWSVSGNVNLAITIDSNRVANITILDKNWRGSETVTFTAKDPGGLTANDKVKLEVRILLGDMNKDNKLAADDAIIILRISVEIIKPDDYQKVAGDMNKDGKIMSNDALILLRTIVGIAAPNINLPIAQTPLNFSIPELRGVSGDVLILPLEVDNTQNLAGGDIQIAYDSNVIQAIEVSTSQNIAMASNISQNGVIRIAFAGSTRLNGKTLASIKFRVINDAVSPIKVKKIDLYNLDGNPIKAIYIDREFRSWAITPERSALLQNFPNPFNPETWIPFQLKKGSNVKIHIYSISGELVQELDLGYKTAGAYISLDRAAYWDGKDKFGAPAASGIYFYNIESKGFTDVHKLIILK